MFCARIATVTALRQALHERLRDEMEAERKRWDRVRNRLRRAERRGLPRLKREDVPKLRLAVHTLGEVRPGKETSVLKRVERLLEEVRRTWRAGVANRAMGPVVGAQAPR